MTRVPWNIFSFLCGISGVFAGGKVLKPDDLAITTLEAYLCEDFEPVVKVDFNFHDGVADIEFDLKEEFTDIYEGKVNISKWVDGAWKLLQSPSGPACEMLNQYLKKSFKNIRQSFTPVMPGDCSVDPGHYKISSFGVSRDDIEITVTDSGKFQTSVVVLDEFDNEVFCIVVEVELSVK